MSKQLVTADPHFGHNNIRFHCGRPFSSVEIMDRTLIDNWNAVVGVDDRVWCIGDFMYRARMSPGFYVRQLNGEIHLIEGNHDHKYISRLEDAGVIVHTAPVSLEIDGVTAVLFHYPMESWWKSSRGSVHLHGHCHGKMRRIPRRCDVGVDCSDFTPIELSSLVGSLAKETR